MTPHEFLLKWRHVELKERSASQSHFNDLCALLGVVDPIAADPHGEWFTFEKGATKTGGGEGWADVWRKGCFASEYKGKRKDLKAAFNQLLQYSVALENPPLLIVSDMDRIRIHTNWTNTVQEVHDFTVEDLIDASKRDRLRQAFLDPEAFKPAKTRQALTEETAREFAGLAQRLRERGHEPHAVAHFVNRLVFCMFAEDVGLLPNKLFTRMLELCRADPAGFVDNAATLFRAMASKGGKVGFESVDWFNGGLFDDDHALPLSAGDIDDLLAAARRDWSAIDPSILGTLFERGLDPAKRSQLGAHYTDRAKIMMIVKPVIIDPLEAEWAEAREQIESAMARVAEAKARRPQHQKDARKVYQAARRAEEAAYKEAQRIRNAFLVRLRSFRVLDPACGSGNFLYLALRALKDIEHRANIEAETLGLDYAAPAVGPECVLGIELNPYAAELARVSVWIGEIQWMRANGFEAAKNPILRPLDTIECRDAILEEDGTRANWPEADVVIGNPPFLGDRKISPELGAAYAERLRSAFRTEVPASADLVCFWFAQAWAKITAGTLMRAGLVATNSIRGGANREVLKPIAEHGSIFEAWSDEGWTVEGAAVRVSIICFQQTKVKSSRLNGVEITEVYPDLTGGGLVSNLTLAERLGENTNIAFQGTISYGPFEVPGSEARYMLTKPGNPNGRPNSDVLKPWTNGQDITKRPSDHWIIFFQDTMRPEDAALYEAPWQTVEDRVRPYRAQIANEALNRFWWRLWRGRSELAAAVRPLTRQIVTPRVSKFRLFVWRPSTVVTDSATVAIARDDDTSFGILHSRLHELWALRMGSSLEDRPRYTPSTTFDTFPFPEGLTPDILAADYADDPRARAIAAAAARLNELRENWLNPADLVVREPEVVPGYPDRVLPRDEEAAKELKKRTLTNLYNARPQWLANAHAALDQAVADAYGWGEDWRAGILSDDEILARLFRLNQERASS
jgi:type II restriction/modification system DNA methylase subunit YeeA